MQACKNTPELTLVFMYVSVHVKLRVVLLESCSPTELRFHVCPQPGCVSYSHCSCEHSPTLPCSPFCADACAPGTLRGLSCSRDSATKVRCLFHPFDAAT